MRVRRSATRDAVAWTSSRDVDEHAASRLRFFPFLIRDSESFGGLGEPMIALVAREACMTTLALIPADLLAVTDGRRGIPVRNERGMHTLRFLG